MLALINKTYHNTHPYVFNHQFLFIHVSSAFTIDSFKALDSKFVNNFGVFPIPSYPPCVL